MTHDVYMHFPVLAIMVLFVGAFLVTLAGKREKLRNVIAGVAVLAALTLLALLIKPVMIGGETIVYWMGNWEPVSGYAIGIAIEVDALSLFFGLLVAIAVACSCFYSFRYIKQDDARGSYFTLYLMLAGGVMGIVLSGDLFNIYVMLEVMTFAAVGLTAFRTWNPNAREAAFKYLVVGSIGSSCVLLGTALVYAQCHTLNLAQISALLPGNMNPTMILAFALLFTGFGCKSFMFPFHPIAADAHGAAPSSVSVLISGVFTKTGVYGIIRVSYFLFRSMGLPAMQTGLVLIGCVSMFVCVTMALNQHDFKRLLAFHSISQIGYILTSLGLCTALGIAGGLYHAINHTLFKGLLFLTAGEVLHATGTVRNWWADSDYTHFQTLCKKAEHFYDGYEAAPGIPANGKETLSENISDIGGVACGLEVLSTMENPDYDAFFRSFARQWLRAGSYETLAGLAQSDVHAPNILRTNRVLSNFQEFFDTYGIQPGDGMYVAPEDRIVIW